MKNRTTFSFSRKDIREMLKNGLLSDFELNQVYLDVVEKTKRRQIIYNVCRIIGYLYGFITTSIILVGYFYFVSGLDRTDFHRARWTHLDLAPLLFVGLFCLLPLIFLEYLWKYQKAKKFFTLARQGYPDLEREDFASRLKLTKPLEVCVKCGGDYFDVIKEKQLCKFCDTTYLVPKEKELNKLTKLAVIRKTKHSYVHLALIGLALMVFVSSRVTYVQAYRERYPDSSGPVHFWQENVLNNDLALLETIPGWSEDLFLSIERSSRFRLGNATYFHGGTHIQEVIAYAGSADYLFTFYSDMSGQVNVAIWYADYEQWWSSVRVSIHYSHNGYIIFRNITSRD